MKWSAANVLSLLLLLELLFILFFRGGKLSKHWSREPSRFEIYLAVIQ